MPKLLLGAISCVDNQIYKQFCNSIAINTFHTEWDGKLIEKPNEENSNLANCDLSSIYLRESYDPSDDSDSDSDREESLPKIKTINSILRADTDKSFPEMLDIVLQSPTILTPSQLDRLRKFLLAARDNFSELPGVTDIVEHHIDTGNAPPTNRRKYPETPERTEIIRKNLKEMLDMKVVREGRSPYSAPVHLVKKKDGSYRFCVDYRQLNLITESDSFPMPLMDDILRSLQGARFLSSLDLVSGFWQCKMYPPHIHKTAFVCNEGQYECLRMPFGLKTAPATFNRLMSKVLAPALHKYALAYLDDVIVFSQTFEEHLTHLQSVFQLLSDAGLYIKLNKSQFTRKEFKFLGSIVSDGKILVDDDKIKSISEFKTPSNLKQVQSFLGMAGWLRRHIKDFSKIARPLSHLTAGKNPKKTFSWSPECQTAFDQIKSALANPNTALSLPDFSKPFSLHSDASDEGLGAVLWQLDDQGQQRVIEYASRQLKKSELNYCISEKEALAIIFAVTKFRPYLQSSKFTIFTDHAALKWLMKTKELKGRLCRWSLIMMEYQYDIQYVKGKDNVIADALSRGTVQPPIDDSEDIFSEKLSPPVLTLNSLTELKINLGPITLSDLKEEQLKQQDLNNIINNLNNKTKLSNYKNYLIKHDILWYHNKNQTNTNPKIVIPRTLIYKVMHEFHSKPSAGHFGVQKTLLNLKTKVHWNLMEKDVELYVNTCLACQLTKSPNINLKGPMQPNFVNAPMSMVSIDLMGAYVRSSKQNRYLLTVVDCYSKWMEVFPLRNSSTKLICKHLHDFFCRYGIPKRIISDNGSQFLSNIYREMCTTWGIQQKFTTVYHPSSSPVERQHKIIKRLIRVFVDSRQMEWDKHIPEFLLAMRSSVNIATGFTPAMLFLGREIDLPWDTLLPPDTDLVPIADRVKTQAKNLKDIHVQTKQNLAKNKVQQKVQYDKKTTIREFNIGDLVKLKAFPQGGLIKHLTTSLMKPWRGPYKIKNKLGPLVYELEDLNNKYLGKYNIVHLFKFNPRDKNFDVENPIKPNNIINTDPPKQSRYDLRHRLGPKIVKI